MPAPRGAGALTAQHTVGAVVALSGAGLHTNRRCRVTLHPAPPGHGRQVMRAGAPGGLVPMDWNRRVPSTMSTTLRLGDGRTVRTVEHLMASLAAYGVDNVRVEVEGPEVPIGDGSARPWCRLLDRVGVAAQPAARRHLRVLRPVQVERQKGFLRIEPAEAFGLDLTYSLVPDFPVMRWAGPLDRARFVAELARSRSFGSWNWRRWLGRPPAARRPFRGQPPVTPHEPDPGLPAARHAGATARLEAALAGRDPAEPVLRGARPGRATLVVGRAILPWPRARDEPVRHVALDMVGDLALAGLPLLGHVVAHNPSHEKTYLLVAALMEDRSAWTIDSDPVPAAAVAPAALR